MQVGQAQTTTQRNRAKVVFRIKDGPTQGLFQSVCMPCLTWHHSPRIEVNQTKDGKAFSRRVKK